MTVSNFSAPRIRDFDLDKSALPGRRHLRQSRLLSRPRWPTSAQLLEAGVNALKQKIHEYNTQQLALRSRAKAIDENKEGILAKHSETSRGRKTLIKDTPSAGEGEEFILAINWRHLCLQLTGDGCKIMAISLPREEFAAGISCKSDVPN